LLREPACLESGGFVTDLRLTEQLWQYRQSVGPKRWPMLGDCAAAPGMAIKKPAPT
jgi:hypothetical protein